MNGDDTPELLLNQERSVIFGDYEHKTTNYTRVAYYDEQSKQACLVGPKSAMEIAEGQWDKYRIESEETTSVETMNGSSKQDTALHVAQYESYLVKTLWILPKEKYILHNRELVSEKITSLTKYRSIGFCGLDDLTLLDELARGDWHQHGTSGKAVEE